MSRTEWESTETRRALAFPGDGLLDLFLGLTLLDAWTILRDPSGATSGGSLVILFPLLLVAKRAITIPRLPRGSADPPRPRTTGRALVLGVAAFLGLLALGVGVALPSPSPAALWDLVALAGLGLVAAAGAHLRARRFVAYAVLTALALGLTFEGSETLGGSLTVALAGVMVGWGGVLLLRFLATRPRAA